MKKSAWLVDGRKFDALSDARQAAETALQALDGKARWRLAVVQGTARFEVAGGPASGYVCHRSVDGRTWAVLVDQDLVPEAMVQVSMGKAVGALPRWLVRDYGSVSGGAAEKRQIRILGHHIRSIDHRCCGLFCLWRD